MELDALAADAAVLRLRLARRVGVSTTGHPERMPGAQTRRQPPVIVQRLKRSFPDWKPIVQHVSAQRHRP